MKIVANIFLAVMILNVTAQGIPQLIKDASESTSDSLRVSLYGRIAVTYRRNNPDSAFYYARKAIALAHKIDNDRSKAAAWSATGVLHYFQSTYDSTIWYYNKAYEVALQLQDSILMGAMLNNIGQTYVTQAKYDTAVQLLIASRIVRAAIDDERVTSSINNLGNAYYKMMDNDRALEYYLEAAELKEKYGQRLSLSNTLNNIGIILKQQQKYSEAIPYYHQSLEIAVEFDDKNKQANAHNNLATLYEEGPKDFTQSEFHYLKAIALKSEMGDKAGLFNTYNNYASLLSTMKKHKEALTYIERAEKLGEELGETMYTADGLLLKSFVLRNLGRFEEAYNTHREAYLIKMDQINEDRNEKIAEWESKFEAVKKEAEIERLSLETDLQKAQLSNARIFLITIIGAAVLLLVFVIIYFQQRSKRQKAENEAQELQIEALQKRLTDLNINHEMKLDLDALNSILHNPLSEREFEALTLSLTGKTNAEIANELFITISTVKFHLRNTYGKLGVSNRKEALQYVAQTS